MDRLKRPVNLRDLGGYIGIEEKKVKKFTLLRSGEVTELDKKDKEILTKDYRLKTIVDFRSEKEKEESPDTKIDGTSYYHIDILKNNLGDVTSLENFKKNLTPEIIIEFMENTYKDFITDDGAILGYREFIDLLLKQKDGSLVFHCFAGKDRTGFAAAVILTILGVSKKDIFNDYLLTNIMRREENSRMLAKLKEYGSSKAELEAMDIALNVRKEYLEASFEKANEVYGSLDGYVREALKVDKEERKYLIEKYMNYDS
ncbi:tyrosine-protein phosphatase [Miniphocaeibacter massiliensis]|uniref:tyrosine-protein phosphatase n=1 Tax=Miniphocaeibacter massiliensis TaxID=2041841 RepID=UPI000C1BDCD0|nr:tyrosine-protein phosphatase [Miniphocaeibacter massiliensis]